MRYLILCCANEAHWNSLPDTERAAVMCEYGAWVQNLDQRGQHIASAQLQPSSTATTLRMRQGKSVVTDGPFAETKEQLGGYHVLDCRDLYEAIAIANQIPTLRVGGTVEVRPILEPRH
jgi:hypothetical protein